MDSYIDNILTKYELSNIHELIYELLPKGYNLPEAFCSVERLHEYPENTQVTTFGYIDKFEHKTSCNGKLTQIKARLYKDGFSFWLNWSCATLKAKAMSYGLGQKAKGNSLVQVTGKIKSYEYNGTKYFYIDHPMLSTVANSNNPQATMFIVPEPLYKLKEGVKTSQVKLSFSKVLENWTKIDKSEWLPAELEKALGLDDLYESIQFVHGLKPMPGDDLGNFLNSPRYLRRLTAEKIYKIIKQGFLHKNANCSNGNFITTSDDIDNIKELLAHLSFELTDDQKKAVWHTMKEFEKKDRSKTLIFGDVGSGKTMVALILSYLMLKRGKQVAILTPASILAKQHYEEAKALLGNSNVFLVHSKTSAKEKNKINALLAKGEPAIIYGTTSVNKLEFTNLSLVVIDEEQKFGVKAKEVLYDNSNAHLIFMTATTIPRTLASTMFSDFAVKKIEQKPAMQKPRITRIARLQDMSGAEIEAIKARMRQGEQTLVIVPSIVSDEIMSVSQAMKKYSHFFPNFFISTINGRMKANEIEQVVESFMKGGVDILIATSMVDSGFSSKTLSHVFIEEAERFGIAQLHQIRGRVGRGNLQGYCYLSPNSQRGLSELSKARLESVVSTENGFELSLKDIEIRGSGDITGVAQCGTDTNFIEWIPQIEIMKRHLKQEFNVS